MAFDAAARYRLRTHGRPGQSCAGASSAIIRSSSRSSVSATSKVEVGEASTITATLCIAAYGFLISERETIPSSAPRAAPWLPQFTLPTDYRPRGAANPNRAPHPKLDHDHATAIDRRSRPKRSAMSLLRPTKRPKQSPQLVTQ